MRHMLPGGSPAHTILISFCVLFPIALSTVTTISGCEGLNQLSVSTCCSTARFFSAGVAASLWTCSP